jgi:hypothetical protein
MSLIMYRKYIKHIYQSNRKKIKRKPIYKKKSLLYNPPYIECKCNVNRWITYHIDNNENEINKHIYDHVMEYKIPKVCCNIVKEYVGKSPHTQENVYILGDDEWPIKILIAERYFNLGHVCFDEGCKDEGDKEVDNFKICSIKRCELSICRTLSSNYCEYHFEQWRNIIHFHNHLCRKCINCT